MKLGVRLLGGIASIALLLTAGCGTLNQIESHVEGPAALGGVRYDIQLMTADHSGGGQVFMAILDFLPSFALDVVIIPFSAINEIVEGGITVHGPPPPTAQGLKEGQKSPYYTADEEAAREERKQDLHRDKTIN